MNPEFFTLTLQDLETLITKGSCLCHIINPNKTRIILWRSKDNPNTYYLRIGIQKFISYPLTDKNSEIYWRFNCFEKEGIHSELSQIPQNEVSVQQKEPKREEVSNSTNPNPVTKYQQENLEKTQSLNNHGSNANSNSS